MSANETIQKNPTVQEVEASCRVPLLALFGGAALWLVVSSVLGLLASIKFHAPDFLADSSWLTYGHVQAAANDALLYGFCIPAGLGVALWLFARIGEMPLRGAMVPVFAANFWHMGVFIGLLAIFMGDSTGFNWLEFPRGGSALLFFAYLLLSLWGMMNFAGRRERTLYPSHWFLIAALFWFPWIYSTANLLLVAWPVRGVVQAIIAWWFANNIVFVWTSLIGIGVAFYFLPRFSGRPLQSYYYALFAFCTLLIFGSWRGVPAGAPVPAWLPTLSETSSMLLIMPVLAIAIIAWKTVRGGNPPACRGGSYCQIKFGMVCFLLSAFALFTTVCPYMSRVKEFTWFGPAQTELQLYGFFAITMFGAIYYLLPRVMGFELSYPKLVRVQHWFSLVGIIIFVGSLGIAGIVQSFKMQSPALSITEITKSILPFLHVSTLGLLLIFIGNLLFAVNIFAMTLVWKLNLIKTVLGAVTAPLENSEVKA
jgi:cytochrome c oxidase cbb3-type subunit I